VLRGVLDRCRDRRQRIGCVPQSIDEPTLEPVELRSERRTHVCTVPWMRRVNLARSLERVDDSAVDIAEQAAFLVTHQLREFTDASRPKPRRIDATR